MKKDLDCLTAGMVGSVFGVSTHCVKAWMDAGTIKGWRLPTSGRGNGDRRFSIEEVRRLMAEQDVPEDRLQKAMEQHNTRKKRNKQ